jgi:hypothetical protein
MKDGSSGWENRVSAIARNPSRDKFVENKVERRVQVSLVKEMSF